MDAQYKKGVIFVFGAILGILLLISKCTSDKYREKSARLEQNVKALNDSIRYKNNKIGTVTASKKAIEATVKELKNEVWVKDERINKLTKDFNKLQSVTKIKTVVTIPEIKANYKDTIPYIFERKSNVLDKWYSFNYNSNQKGLTIYDFKLHNETFIVIGQKRDGIFKKPYWEADVTNTNPYFKTTDIQIQVIQEKTPFYNKFWFRMVEIGLAGAAGAAISK